MDPEGQRGAGQVKSGVSPLFDRQADPAERYNLAAGRQGPRDYRSSRTTAYRLSPVRKDT
jgi:hypothetical protein